MVATNSVGLGSPELSCETVICIVLAPLSIDDLKEDLKQVHFVSFSIHNINMWEIKMVPVLVRYFLPSEGMIDLGSITGETSELLSSFLVSVIKKYELEQKVIGFCADNCNTNFGGMKRRGEKNVYHLLNNEFHRELLGIFCAAHIVHNCLQTAVDVLPIDVEVLAVKIYKYFHIYTVHVMELKSFCDFVDIEYNKLLQHGNTRFLSLLPALERILNMFQGLKSYFCSQEQCPTVIKKFFENECREMYLQFVDSCVCLIRQF